MNIRSIGAQDGCNFEIEKQPFRCMYGQKFYWSVGGQIRKGIVPNFCFVFYF